MKQFSWVGLGLILLVSACGVSMPDCRQEFVQVKNELSPIRLDSKSPSQSQAVAVASFGGKYEKRHPEQKPDEVFETNGTIEQFLNLPYKTKRMGRIAYDIHGREVGDSGTGRYFPIFIKVEEREIEQVMKKEHFFTLHFWTKNYFIQDAEVTLIGALNPRSDAKQISKTFRLEKEKNLGLSWEGQLMVPRIFCLLKVIVKPRGKKSIEFLVARQLVEGGSINILLSSCPLPETFTRPRISIDEKMGDKAKCWPVNFYFPDKAVVQWTTYTGAKVYSAPLPLWEAKMVFEHGRQPGTGMPSLFRDDTKEFSEAVKQRRAKK